MTAIKHRSFQTRFLYNDLKIRHFVTMTSSPSIMMVKEFNTLTGLSISYVKAHTSSFKGCAYHVAGITTEFNSVIASSFVKPFTTVMHSRDVYGQLYGLHPVACWVGGNLITLTSASVSVSESSLGYSATLNLAVLEQLAFIKIHDPVVLTVGGQTYNLIVDSLPLTKQGSTAPSFSIRAISPIRQYEEPRHRGISKVWDDPVLASEVAKELIPTLHWDVVDWVIPAYRLAVENETPLKVLNRIVSACGGILTATQEGIAVVQYEYPFPTTEYSDATSTHSLNDIAHLMVSIQEVAPMDGTNYLVVSDVRQEGVSSSDTLESEVLTVTRAKVTVYPSPLRRLTLESTAPESITIAGGGDPQDAIWEDEVEVFNGRGSLTYPIYAIEDVDYVSLPISGLYFTDGAQEIYSSNENACGILKVKYWTKRIQYVISNVESAKVQFILREEIE